MNRLQIQIFKKLSNELNLEVEDYLLKFSKQYVSPDINTLNDLTEKEDDSWITRAYLESVG